MEGRGGEGGPGCGCYDHLIAADLAVWKGMGGIKWEEFQAALELPHHGVHYQIIGHRLFRQEHCMFPSR